MSRALLLQLRHCGSRYKINNNPAIHIQMALKSFTSSNNRNDLGQSTILVQQGADIHELPVIVRRLGQDEFIALCNDKLPSMNGENQNGSNPAGASDNNDDNNSPGQSTRLSLINVEEVIKNVENCLTTNGILLIIDSISEEDLTPEICICALNKITRIETLVTLQNVECGAGFQKIVRCLVIDGSNDLLLTVLGGLKSYIDLSQTIETVCEELLKRSLDSKLSIEETCDAIIKFTDVRRNASAEKFWSSLIDQERSINHLNVRYVYQVLPHIKMSRRTLSSILDKKITTLWWQLSIDAVTDILEALKTCQLSSYRTMSSLGRWTNTNIHALSEAALETVVTGFTQLEHSDHQIERALERYVKAKGVKIKSQSLIVALLNHCVKFRLRNHHILNGCSEYFISNADNIEPGYLKKIICPFGYLDYQPLNAIKFWQTLEHFIDKSFSKIPPNDVIDIMLACVYLELYPMNFVKHIFNPYFLDVLHTTNSPDKLYRIRSNLKLFDTSLTLECESYEGPLLPKDNMAKSVWLDGRIRRIANQISNELAEISGGPECVSKSVVLYQLPINELYIVDVLFHPKGLGNIWSFNVHKERNIHVAVLIQLPEHFDSTGEYLIGPQAMRIRHFRKMGMKVVTLKYEKLAKLKIYPKDLNKYLVSRMKAALPAISEN